MDVVVVTVRLSIPTFSLAGSVPEPAALPLFPAVLLRETPRRGPGRLCWLAASSQPLPAEPRLPSQCQCPGVLQKSPFPRVVARD